MPATDVVASYFQTGVSQTVGKQDADCVKVGRLGSMGSNGLHLPDWGGTAGRDDPLRNPRTSRTAVPLRVEFLLSRLRRTSIKWLSDQAR